MKKYFPHFPRRPLHSVIKIQVNVGELVSETCYSSQVNFPIPCPALIRRCNSLLWKACPRWWIKGQVRWEFVLYLCGVRKWPKPLTLILLTSWRSPCFLFSLSSFKGTLLVLLLFTAWKLKAFSTFRWIEVMFVVYAWPLEPLPCSAIGLLVGLMIKKGWGGDRNNFEITIRYSRS